MQTQGPCQRPRASGPGPCPHFPAADLPVTWSKGSELQPCDRVPTGIEGAVSGIQQEQAGPSAHSHGPRPDRRRHANSARPRTVKFPQGFMLPLKRRPPTSEAGRNATGKARPGPPPLAATVPGTTAGTTAQGATSRWAWCCPPRARPGTPWAGGRLRSRTPGGSLPSDFAR